jgi:hypothetical protein
LDARVQALTRIPITHAEFIQVLRYNKLEHYSAHHDYFNPGEYANNKQMLNDIKHGVRCSFFRQEFALEDAIELHAVAPLEALPYLVDQCHSFRCPLPLTGSTL